MELKSYDMTNVDIAWCPGCGNFSILSALKQALAELDITSEKLLIVSGIGQAAKIPQYLKCNYFNGLHGRALPAAAAAKMANPEMTVIAESGDGCMYGEGGNHFVHAIRRNPDITNIVHNNMVYGLTKGQASPTSGRGFKTSVQTEGVFAEPFNPIAAAISLNVSFAARAFAGDLRQAKEVLKRAILHKGYSLVDILQPCPTFNKVNTYEWFKNNTYSIDENHDVTDKIKAFEKAVENEKLALGVFYENKNMAVFEESLPAYKENSIALCNREFDKEKLANALKSFR